MPLLTRRALLSQLAFAAPSAVESAGTHTLICIFLRGGADTLNMWVPYADDAYYRQRPTISIKRPGSGTDAAIKLDDHYALHPAMQPLYDPLRSLVHAAAERPVRDVFVDGRQVVADGEVLTIDRPAATRAIAAHQSRIAAAVPRHDPLGRSIETIVPRSLPLVE